MLARCTDPRPWLFCAALCCASVAYVAGAVVAIPPWLDGVLASQSYHATGAPDDPADPEAGSDSFHDPSLIWGPQVGSAGEHAGVPVGFVPLVWRKGVDPKPVLISA